MWARTPKTLEKISYYLMWNGFIIEFYYLLHSFRELSHSSRTMVLE